MAEGRLGGIRHFKLRFDSAWCCVIRVILKVGIFLSRTSCKFSTHCFIQIVPQMIYKKKLFRVSHTQSYGFEYSAIETINFKCQ